MLCVINKTKRTLHKPTHNGLADAFNLNNVSNYNKSVLEKRKFEAILRFLFFRSFYSSFNQVTFKTDIEFN